MYLRTTQRRNKDGSIVRYYALAENVRHVFPAPAGMTRRMRCRSRLYRRVPRARGDDPAS